MGAIILFEFPSANANARSWILDHAAILAIAGMAEIKFIGTEPAKIGEADAETIALEFGSIDQAHATLSQWHREAEFSGLISTRLLQVNRVTLANALFP
jgi:hypothetical protein